MLNPPSPPPPPREQLPITLFEHIVLSARTDEGRIYLSFRDLCHALGLDLPSQRRRVNANSSLQLMQLRILQGRQLRVIDFLPLDDVAVWIMSIQTLRVSPEVRTRFEYVKTYLEASVRQAFAALTGLPEGPSNSVEDLSDLDRVELALREFTDLRDRQAQIEQSQDRARGAYRDLLELVRELRGRVQALEAQAQLRLSPAQRGTLYQMIHVWGEARAERDPQLPAGAAIRRCWRELHARFGISTYTDLPAAQVDTAVAFIQAHYQTLTGHELPVIAQPDLEGLNG